MGWLSVKALEADESARRQAALEENARLALWRMDSFLTPIVAQESARPFSTFNSFYAAERPAGKKAIAKPEAEITLPSPMLAQATPYVLLHFQIDPENA